jgi:hypothetical protein
MAGRQQFFRPGNVAKDGRKGAMIMEHDMSLFGYPSSFDIDSDDIVLLLAFNLQY